MNISSTPLHPPRTSVPTISTANRRRMHSPIRKLQVTGHPIAGLSCYCFAATASSARTSAGTSASPPSRVSRSASGTVRRTSTASCT